ncbi:hypothetical protein NQ315_003250, partial [Exocentrus adspersus]
MCKILKSRVSNRVDSENFRFPIILPNEHSVTKKLVIETHEKLCHVSLQGLLCSLREKYWILGGRRFIRSMISRCVICRKHRSKALDVKNPALPLDR